MEITDAYMIRGKRLQEQWRLTTLTCSERRDYRRTIEINNAHMLREERLTTILRTMEINNAHMLREERLTKILRTMEINIAHMFGCIARCPLHIRSLLKRCQSE
jgi:hypothetical protein